MGGRQKYKNFDNVVYALEIRDYKLKIVGGGGLDSNERLFNNHLGDRYDMWDLYLIKFKY